MRLRPQGSPMSNDGPVREPTIPTVTAGQVPGVKTSVAHPPMTVNWPADVPGVVIQLSRWMSLRHRIANCRRRVNAWVVLGSAFLGSFLSVIPNAHDDVVKAAIAQTTLLTTNTVECGASFVLAVLCWLSYRSTSTAEADSIWSAVYEMDAVARECGHDPKSIPSPFDRPGRLRRLIRSLFARGVA